MKRYYFALLAVICALGAARSQNRVYFVDGYHGGVYGHYPLEWKTQFMVDELAKHPEWRIGLEIEPETWDSVRVHTPVAYENFRSMAADRRVEFTNPAYAQPYCYNVSGESIIRQFEYGIRKTREHFPDVEFVTYSVEEPCFTSSLPVILTGFGFRYAVLKCPNTCWGGYSAPYGGQLVNWIGPDGTKILTVPRYACEELEDNSVWQTKAWGNHSDYIAACIAAGIENPVGMTYQDAGWKGGPWLGSGDGIRNNSTYVTWREYIEKVTDGKTDDDYRMSQEDVRPALMWGSQVLQRIARQVRTTENRIVVAEKMAAMASLVSDHDYPQDDIDEAWRTLMLAQHHDSWIVPYNGLHGKGTWADAIARWTSASDVIADGVIAAAKEDIMNRPAGGEDHLTVFNTLGVTRREVVSLELPGQDGGRISAEVEVPPFGYSTIRVTPGMVVRGVEREVTGGEYVLENDMYRIVIDAARGGIIKSLVAKREGGKEYAATGDYALGELRGHFYDEGRFRSSKETPAKITVTADSPLEKSVRIAGEIAGSPFTQQITIRLGQRRIDFALEVDWKGNPGIGEFRQNDAFDNNRRAFYDDRFKLNVMFPVALTAPALYKDAPFDVCESSLPDTHFQTWDAIKHNIILHWVDLVDRNGGHGLALLSDHTTSYSYGPDFPLALTVQYSGNGLWGRNYEINRPTQIRFALIPHSGAWDKAGVQEENLRWNEPLLCSLHNAGRPEARSLVDATGSGYEISTAYPVEEGILVRLYNGGGDAKERTIRFGFPVASLNEVDLGGNHVGEMKIKRQGGGAEAKLSIPRFGIKTFIVKKTGR